MLKKESVVGDSVVVRRACRATFSEIEDVIFNCLPEPKPIRKEIKVKKSTEKFMFTKLSSGFETKCFQVFRNMRGFSGQSLGYG